MRILTIAYACEPNRGSEPGVGWNWVNNVALIENNNLTVITRSNNRHVIEKYNEIHGMNKINFLYYDLPPKILKYKKGDKNIKLFFTLWQIGVTKYIKEYINLKDYDYIWDFNFGSLSLPTFVYKLEHPYFIGPVSTKKSVPSPYIKKLSLVNRIKYKIQQFMRENLWTNPITWKALKKAEKIITCNELSREFLPKEKKNNSISVFHNGLNQEDFNINIQNIKVNEPISFIYAGRLIKSKNIDIAIDSLNYIKEKGYKFTFDIIGKGPEESNLRNIVHKKELDEYVRFYNKVSQKELFDIYYKRDFLLFPSLLEISSTSVMEAMSCGLIPICLDIPCMEYITNCESVIKIQNISPEVDTISIAEEIIKLIMDKEKIIKLKRISYSYANENFMWKNKLNEVKKMLNFINTK